MEQRSTAPQPAPASAPPHRHPRWLLTALLGAMCLGSVDIAIANVATPSIHANLHASGGQLEMVVSGYTLAYALLLITGARLGETHGHRHVFLLGLGLFTLASLACGLAPTAIALIVARIVQGGAAALMASQVLTGIQLNFEGVARTRALGLYAAVLAGSAVAGQILGGVLIGADLFGTAWRPAFLINVPLGTALMALAGRFLPADQASGSRRLDLGGVVTLSAALLLLVLPLVLGRDQGWPAWTWASLAASVPAFAFFAGVERRLAVHGGRPLINLELLVRSTITWGLTSLALGTSTYFALLFVLALYLQQGLGKSPTESGLALVPWVAAFGIAGPVLGRASARVKSWAAPVGSLIMGAGFAGIAASLLAGHGDGAGLLILLGVGGLGYGTSFSGILGHLTGVVPRRYAPDLSGVFNTTSRVGGVVGVAVFGTAYFAVTPAPGPQAAIHGFAIIVAALAAASAVAAGLAYLSTRRAAAVETL
jgi:MFS family permease